MRFLDGKGNFGACALRVCKHKQLQNRSAAKSTSGSTELFEYTYYKCYEEVNNTLYIITFWVIKQSPILPPLF